MMEEAERRGRRMLSDDAVSGGEEDEGLDSVSKFTGFVKTQLLLKVEVLTRF